ILAITLLSILPQLSHSQCASATTSLPYNGISGNAEFSHSSTATPAAGPQEQCATNYRLTYTSTPATDGTTNHFGNISEPANGLSSADFGGEASFNTFIIDVSGVNQIDIETFGQTQGTAVFDAATEYFEWWYTLDGSAPVVFLSTQVDGSLAAIENNVDVTGVSNLVVGFTFNINGAGDGFSGMNVTVVESSSAPQLHTSATTLSGFIANAGTVSAFQNFTLTGSNLSPLSGNIVITAPNNFELSLDNSSFSNSVNVSYSSGVANQVVYVRISDVASTGAVTGIIAITGGGAAVVNVVLNGTVCPSLGTVFKVGDISILGFNSDAPDQFSFVTWVNIPPGTEISFTEQTWTGTELNSNEGTITWQNNTGSTIQPGTVIVYTSGLGFDLGTESSSSGTFALSTEQDNLFVFEGTLTCPSFIYGFTNNSWLTSGTASTSQSYLPATLNVTNGNLAVSSTLDNWEFSISRNGLATISDYKTLVNSNNNWTGDNTSLTLSSTDFTTTTPKQSVELSASAESGSEIAASTITITATASGPVNGDQTVALAISGTGITALDYAWTNNGVITITNGSTSGSITFTVVDDSDLEETETATLSYAAGSLSPGLILGTSTSVNIAINDNDATTLYSQTSGGTNAAIWDIVPNGTPQLVSAFGGFSAFKNVVIQSGHTVTTTTSGHEVKSLTVESGAKLYSNNATDPEYIELFGDVVNNGIIGNGTSPDLISFNLRGVNPITFSGSGNYDIGRIRKETGPSGSVTIMANVNLYYPGACIFNNYENSTFDLTISSGKKVRVLHPNGVVAIDGPTGESNQERGGSITVNGTLEIANKLLAVSNNTTLNCDISIGANGKIVTKDADIDIHGTSSFNIDTGGMLEINGTLAVKGGTLNSNRGIIINNGATLLHGVGTANAGGQINGSVIVKRQGTSSGVAYNYWSSPINSGTIPGIESYLYNSTLGTQSVDDDPTGDPGWVPYAGSMTVGQGYASRGGNLATFSGTVNNGDISVPLNYQPHDPTNINPGTPFNLVGNPYPGAINASSFVAANSNIDGALYFWNDDLSGGNGYDAQDYAVWNGTGATGTGANSTPPNGYIGSCQGFMVRAISTGNLSFRNSMRAANSAVFYKSSEESAKMWLSLRGKTAYSEILIGMLWDATDGEDRLYDAVKLRGNSGISLSALNQGQDYAIMAFPPPYQEKVIPLRVFSNSGGTHVFHAHDMTHFMDYQVYLEDKKSAVSDLVEITKGTKIMTILDKGENDNRFFLHFRPSVQTGINSSSNSKLLVYTELNQVTIQATGNALGKGQLQVINANGQVIETANQVMLDNTPYTINTTEMATGVYHIRFRSEQAITTQRFVRY
ncbi:T9SS type A sorting domain-containing protein, partial [Bacteroidota bacterium]